MGYPPRIGLLEVVEGAGLSPRLDRPDRYWPLIVEFVTSRRRTDVQ